MDLSAARLEGTPTGGQQSRLQGWLRDLELISIRHRIAVDTDDGEVRIIDLGRGSVVGIGLSYLTDDDWGPERVICVDASGSILDGSWLVETTDGLMEQRLTRGWTTGPGGPA